MKYGLIGEHLSHSFSKPIHESLAPYTYEICEIAPTELFKFFERREFSAINVTIPYKAAVIPLLDEISNIAKSLSAVNTVVNRNGRLYGYNTDYFGMRDLILRSGADLSQKKVLILGTGGTARTSSLVCKDLGAGSVLFVSREQKAGAVTYADAYEHHKDAQIIINTTPVGMYPSTESIPICIDGFPDLEAVFDAVYNPLRTSLVLSAKRRGIIAEGGLYMLVTQAVYAAEHFLGRELDRTRSQDIFAKTVKEKENIVLIGMPSSGKTTVGTILASTLDRKLVDLDDEIENRIGMTIAQYFKDHTEADFRDIESEVTQEISKQNGMIIATGGGCVLRQKNVDSLKQNGRLYFLDRSPNTLTPTASRPLAQTAERIERLYRERYGIYISASDVRIDADTEAQRVAAAITKEFYQ